MGQTEQRALPTMGLGRVFYGWWLVALTGLIMAISGVPLFHALGIWIVALERHFGWSRTQLSLAFVFSRVEGGFLGPVEGYLTDRLGPQRMVLIGLLILGPAFVLFGLTQTLWMFYLSYIIMSLGQGLGGWIPMMTTLNNWFLRRRSMAMGWANVGNRLGALLLIPAIAWAVDPDADRLGWRWTAVIVGLIVLVLAYPISRVVRNRPEEYGQRPDGDADRREVGPSVPGGSSTPAGEVETPGLTAGEAIRTPAFWLISVGHGLTVSLLVAMVTHLALMLIEEPFDFSLQTAAWVMATYMGTSMVSNVVGGYVGDRVPKNLTIFVCSVIQGASVLAITLVHNAPMAFLFAVAFGIGDGGRNPLTIAIRGDYFGRRAFGSLLGLSQLPMNICLLLAPLLTGVYRDIWGSYTLPFYVLGALSAFGGFLILIARSPMAARAAASGTSRG